MRFLGNLGIDGKLLVAQIINFGILVWILQRFVLGPVVRRIEEDEQKLQEAERLRARLQALEEAKKEELRKAREKAGEIVAQAQQIAQRLKAQAQREALEERRKIIEQIQARLREIEQPGKDAD